MVDVKKIAYTAWEDTQVTDDSGDDLRVSVLYNKIVTHVHDMSLYHDVAIGCVVAGGRVQYGTKPGAIAGISRCQKVLDACLGVDCWKLYRRYVWGHVLQQKSMLMV